MKTNIYIFSLVFVLLLAGLSSGCSVTTSSVANRPPDLSDVGVSKLETPEYGDLEAGDTTFFMLPKGLTETQAASKFKAIGLLSQEIDRLATIYLTTDQSTLPTLFLQTGCPALATDPNIQVNSSDIVWQKIDQADPRFPTLTKCQSLTEQSQAEVLYALAGMKFGELIKDGGGTKDIYLNQLTLLNPADVGVKDVVLKFTLNKATFSSSPTGSEHAIRGAFYSPKQRALVFSFDEVVDKKPTGLVYQVQLERSEDFLKSARFKGDANLVDSSGKVVQNGSLQITGPITKPEESK